MLVHWDRLALAEAAHVLGVNPSTARSRYATARATLRETLAIRDAACAAPTKAPQGSLSTALVMIVAMAASSSWVLSSAPVCTTSSTGPART